MRGSGGSLRLEVEDIHPANKQQVGRRLALLALANTYDRRDVVSFRSEARFQQPVSNLNVFSNVKGIVNGTSLAGGNIPSFGPDNYGAANSGDVPNASAQVYDLGINPPAADGYACEIHNHDAKQTLFRSTIGAKKIERTWALATSRKVTPTGRSPGMLARSRPSACGCWCGGSERLLNLETLAQAALSAVPPTAQSAFGNSKFAGWATCDTAGWQPSLQAW